MPFIDCKITEQLSDDKKEIVKTKLGQAVSLLHKSENYLMVGLCGGYDLFMAGKKLRKGAYVSVSLYGNATSADYENMTGAICSILREELSIPAESVYVTYHGIADWGWNGSNF